MYCQGNIGVLCTFLGRPLRPGFPFSGFYVQVFSKHSGESWLMVNQSTPVRGGWYVYDSFSPLPFEVLGVASYPGAVHVLGCDVHSLGVNADSDFPVQDMVMSLHPAASSNQYSR